MQITITQQQLAVMVGGFRKIIRRASTLPVLEHVRFTTDAAGSAAAEMTNLDETLVYTVGGRHAPGLDFLCPVQALIKALKDLKKDAWITLGAAAGSDGAVLTLALCVGRQTIETTVATLSAEDFPSTLLGIALEPAPVESLLAGYRRVAVFASSDPSRPVLNGVFWDAGEQRLAATDGQRLATSVVTGLPLTDDLILPSSKFMRAPCQPEADGRAGVAADSASNRWLALESGPWLYQTRCVQGTYPNYKNVIPPASSEFAATVQFAKEDLPLVKNAVSQFTEGHRPYLYVYAGDGIVSLLSMSGDSAGNYAYVLLPNSASVLADVSVPVVHGVTAAFLLQGLEAGYLAVRIPAGQSPWRCTDGNDVHALMPCRETETAPVAAFVQRSVLPAHKERPPQPSPEPVRAPAQASPAPAVAPVEAPVAETAPEVAAETAPEAVQTAAETPAAGLRLVPKETTFEQLLNEITDTQELVRRLGSKLNSIRTAARAAEKEMKNRGREFQNTRKVLAALKEAAGF